MGIQRIGEEKGNQRNGELAYKEKFEKYHPLFSFLSGLEGPEIGEHQGDRILNLKEIMSICDSEENRKKLAWLVPGYILLAWFFCVLFQPLGIRSPNSRYHPRLTKYGEQIIYLTSDDSNAQHCRNNGSII